MAFAHPQDHPSSRAYKQASRSLSTVTGDKSCFLASDSPAAHLLRFVNDAILRAGGPVPSLRRAPPTTEFSAANTATFAAEFACLFARAPKVRLCRARRRDAPDVIHFCVIISVAVNGPVDEFFLLSLFLSFGVFSVDVA